MDWSLLTCAIRGHFSYAPEEPGLRARLHATSASGEAWRCLRCGTFAPGAPSSIGPAAEAPAVRRGKELRSAFILRLFAVERLLRAIIFAVIAYVIWRFKSSRTSIEQAFDHDLPVARTLLRELGYNVDHSKLIGLIQHAFTLDPRTLTWLARGVAVYALLELVEAFALWQLKRWGEYFAMVVTSIFIPYEVYDLYLKVTPLRLVAFAINVALVVYLVLTKRLFGARGGKKAYDARLRGASIIDSELAALAAQEQPGTPAGHDGGEAAGDPAEAAVGPEAAGDPAQGTGDPAVRTPHVGGTAPGPVSPGQPGGVPRR